MGNRFEKREGRNEYEELAENLVKNNEEEEGGKEGEEEGKAIRRNQNQNREYGVEDVSIRAKLEPTGTQWDNLIALQENKPVKSKPKGYHLSVSTIDGVKVLSKKLKKTESQFVDEVLAEIVSLYTEKKGKK